jgi:hypothetical protein
MCGLSASRVFAFAARLISRSRALEAPAYSRLLPSLDLQLATIMNGKRCSTSRESWSTKMSCEVFGVG